MKISIAIVCAMAFGTIPAPVTAADPDDRLSNSPAINCLVIYRPGPAWLKGKPLSAQPLKEHGRYMLSLYAKGALKLAGPLGDNAGGAVLLIVPDRAAAEAIVRDDPAVRSGIFEYEIHEWHVVPWEQYLR